MKAGRGRMGWIQRVLRQLARLGGAILLLLWASGQVAGQQVLANPHGPLPEGLDCSACHLVDSWTPTRAELDFTHGEISGFALTGRHAEVECVGCHVDLRFDAPEASASDCAACHVDVHERQMTAPCVSCHTTESFRNVSGESVHLRTLFPLTGAHLQVSCESCHSDDRRGAFAANALDVECVGCHLSDYQTALSIDHAASGFPTDCTQCHSAIAWNDAPAFAHEAVSGGFALLGAHEGLRCASCHAQPGNQLLFPIPAGQEDCIACHQDDYDREHGGSGFPTTCLTCHSYDDWESGAINHDELFFPIYSGRHEGEWDDCSTCHTAPGDFQSFTCLNCHEHRQSEADDEHREVPGYIYESSRCYACHPSGRS